VEVLASHGDTHLGGDDFDQLLLDFVSEEFLEEHGVDLREVPTAKSRLLQAVEEAKKRLSFEAFTTIAEEFIAEKDGRPLNLTMELDRSDYEEMIMPLLQRTIDRVDAALSDAKLRPADIDKIILVGGASRTPLVQQLLQQQLQREPHLEIDPDLCVAMGAAVQGGMIAGVDVGPVLVDITPHTLGIECVGLLHGVPSPYLFSPIIARNTPLPARRSDIYYTGVDGQQRAEIHVLQGEDEDARNNQSTGRFMLEGLDEQASQGSEILVRFDLNLDGMLIVTAVERDTGLEKRLTIDNAITRFQAQGRDEAKARIAAAFDDDQPTELGQPNELPAMSDEMAQTLEQARDLIAKSQRLVAEAGEQDAQEITELVEQLQLAIEQQSPEAIQEISQKLEDVVFYLEDA
jgi:molecular chaperone DnaK